MFFALAAIKNLVLDDLDFHVLSSSMLSVYSALIVITRVGTSILAIYFCKASC